MLELRVRDAGDDVLVYTFRSAAEASEIIRFLSDFFPRAQFVLQPLSH